LTKQIDADREEALRALRAVQVASDTDVRSAREEIKQLKHKDTLKNRIKYLRNARDAAAVARRRLLLDAPAAEADAPAAEADAPAAPAAAPASPTAPPADGSNDGESFEHADFDFGLHPPKEYQNRQQ